MLVAVHERAWPDAASRPARLIGDFVDPREYSLAQGAAETPYRAICLMGRGWLRSREKPLRRSVTYV
jgi:hypothetical protein